MRGKNNTARMDTLEDRINSIEHELAVRTKGANSNSTIGTHRWKDVRDRLKADEAAVEIVRFRRFENHWTDTTIYAAIIVTGKTRKYPDIVILGNGNELDAGLYQEYLAAIHPRHASNTNMSMKEYRATFASRLKQLYTQYWAPIQRHLNGVRRVYVSSDGVYHRINLNTLMTPEGRYLLDALDIRLLSNTSDLLREETPQRQNRRRTALVMARPDYDHAPARNDSGKTDSGGAESYASAERSGSRMVWKDLTYTEDEGRLIASTMRNNSWQVALRLGREAVETELEVLPSPALIHIATHGFFLRDSVEATDIFSTSSDLMETRNPLLRSGLVFAGANSISKSLVENESALENSVKDDGVLLAEEVSHLRLEETELVVMSACETASGEVLGGEGVYGLQRSFLLAGARNVMMSLWSIEDNAAFALMERFYNSFIKKSKDARYSLRDAQRQMVRDGFLPCDWGAFVILSR
jgi:CHAT domain-containing protein